MLQGVVWMVVVGSSKMLLLLLLLLLLPLPLLPLLLLLRRSHGVTVMLMLLLLLLLPVKMVVGGVVGRSVTRLQMGVQNLVLLLLLEFTVVL